MNSSGELFFLDENPPYPLILCATPPVADRDSLDWKDYGTDSIINTVCNHKHMGPGTIILCHNGAKYTPAALDSIITNLQQQGYEFVPISELIYKENYEMDVEGRQHQKSSEPATSASAPPA